MTIFLLVVIYVAFVGLGIPDSIFGPAWPQMYVDLGYPISYADFITTVLYSSTVLSSLMSGFVIKKLGTGLTTCLSTVLTAIGLILFSISSNIVILCLCAIPLGLGAGSIDAALNHYVARNYKASHMSFLHCAYGVGVTVSPFFMSLALGGDGGWRGGYRIVFYIQVAISIMTIIALPVWKKVKQKDEINNFEPEKINGMRDVIKIRRLWLGLMIFFGSCALEFTCGIWSSSFLVNGRNYSAETAAFCLTFYYVGITLGRFFSGFLNKKFSPWHIVIFGEILSLVGVLLIFIDGGEILYIVSLMIIGLGNGPLFPNMTYLTKSNFGKENAQSAIGIQMAVSNISILIMPPIFGFIAEWINISLFPEYLLLMHLIMSISTIFFIRCLIKNKNFNIKKAEN